MFGEEIEVPKESLNFDIELSFLKITLLPTKRRKPVPYLPDDIISYFNKETA